jgi:hypothetical protein
MSLAFEIRGKMTGTWTITSLIGSQIGRVSAGETKNDAELIFGGKDGGPGIERIIDRTAILQAIKKILPVAKIFPRGFQVRVPPYERLKIPEQVGSGLGFAANGKGYTVHCFDDYWQIQSSEDFLAMQKAGQYIESPKHFEPTEIITDQWGTIKIEPRKRGGHDLAWLLRQIKKFLESDPSEKVTIIWG